MKKFLNFTSVLLILGLTIGLSSCKKENNNSTISVPEELAVANIGPDTATFTWTGEEEAYEIAIGTDNNISTVNAKTFVATGLTPETEYTWKVRAVNGTDYSEWVNGTAFTTLSSIVAPTGLVVENILGTMATFKWQGEAANYELAINDNTPISINGKNYQADDLTPSTNYTWKVRSVEDDKYSVWVNGPSFSTTADTDKIKVTFGNDPVWTPELVEAYHIFYGDSEFFAFLFAAVFDTNTNKYDIPFVEFTCDPEVGTTFYSEDNENDYIWYYDSDYDSRPVYHPIMGYTGNWWVDEGTTTITKVEDMQITGSMDVMLYDAYALIVQQNPDPEFRSLKINFKDVPYTTKVIEPESSPNNALSTAEIMNLVRK